DLVRHTGIPLPGGRCTADELPSATGDAAHARLRLRRSCTGARGLPPRRAGTLPIFQRGRRHADRAPRRGRRMEFAPEARDGPARRGRLSLAHGTVETPAFMPVGTYGAVTGVAPSDLHQLGAQIVLSNTFHLWLRPGLEVIGLHGGL